MSNTPRPEPVDPSVDLLDSWINGNRQTVRALLDHKRVRTFARMLAIARDEIREDLIKTFAAE